MSNPESSTFEELLAISEPALHSIALRLREIILSLDPNACEVVRLGDKASTFGIGPKKMSEGYVYILPYKNWVNLGFYRGAHLADPEALLEGTGKNMRHIKIKSIEDVNNPKLKALIKAAKQERELTLKK